MSTELRKGGIFTKINLNGYLKNNTNQEQIKISTKAIKTKNKLTFYLDNDKYTLKINSPKKLILNRVNDELNSTIYFEYNKIIKASYIIKQNDISLDINIKTNNIEINNNFIKVKYTVIDSNIEYEYYIEMSG